MDERIFGVILTDNPVESVDFLCLRINGTTRRNQTNRR